MCLYRGMIAAGLDKELTVLHKEGFSFPLRNLNLKADFKKPSVEKLTKGHYLLPRATK